MTNINQELNDFINKKNGRKPRPELRRSTRFSLYLSESEFKKIKIAAIGEYGSANSRQETARQMSEFIRKSALNQPIDLNRSIPPCNIELIMQIGGMSNNLNQAVRLAHAVNFEKSVQFDLVCKELLGIITKIRNELIGNRK